MTMRMARGAVPALLLGAALAPALAAQTPASLSYTVTDGEVRGPTTFAPGNLTISVANRGNGVHQLMLVRVASGREAPEARTFLLANSALPRWAVPVIGIGPVPAGQTISVTGPLDPGDYLVIDPLIAANGTPNFKNGLTIRLTGRGSPVTDLPAVPAVAGLMVTDRFFRFGSLIRSGNTWTLTEGRNRITQLRPGLQTIRIDATTTGGHSVVLVKGGPEVMRQYAAWLDGRRPAPPPGITGGIASIPAGQLMRYFLQVRLAPGTYMLFCPASHARFNARGFESGEYAQFAVR